MKNLMKVIKGSN